MERAKQPESPQPQTDQLPTAPKQRKRTPQPRSAAPDTLPAAPQESQRQQGLAFARLVHGPIAGGIGYAAASKHLRQCDAFTQTAQQFTSDFIERVAPRDPVEELLAVQMLYAHGRAGYLSTQAVQQRDPKKVKVFHEAADGATNTFRKLMLGLAQYRRPPRGGDTFMAIRQTNVAEQQVVHNQVGATPRGAGDVNQQHAVEHADPAPQATQAALPPVAGGTGVAELSRSPQSTLVEEHRPEDVGGQGAFEDERVPARGKVRRSRRAA